ncbi:MAG: hypothetical protein JXR96_00395 [Deltaproteobacteria bacterium]|nr:hypothetical protein [Deltaproteobacteria bacterium]
MVRRRLLRAGAVLLALAACGLASACEDGGCEPGVEMQFEDIVILGQSYYPSHPDPRWYAAFSWHGGAVQACLERPSAFQGDFVTQLQMFPGWPFCPVSESGTCGSIHGFFEIIGPKRAGHVHQVERIGSDEDVSVMSGYAEAEIRAYWEERIDDEQKVFESSSVSGSAEVLSESPLRIGYRLEFRDEAGQSRRVSLVQALDLGEHCEPIVF